MKTTSVILAAGKGTRMKSDLPKVLHPLWGEPLVQHALAAAAGVTAQKPVMVIGHRADQIRKAVGDRARYVVQEEQLGTGHAVQQAERLLKGETEQVLVTNGDMPLIRSDTLQALVKAQEEHDGPFSMLTVEFEDPRGFGRVIRGAEGHVRAVVEEVDASPEELKVRELNASVYCFSADWLWQALKKIELSPKGEYYLTDLVEIAVEEGHSIRAIKTADHEQLIGINNRVHLSEAARILQRRINESWMMAGVSMPDPRTVYIEGDVEIGRDTVILPNTHLQGKSVIGKDCVIGPNSAVFESEIGDRCRIKASVVEQALLENDVEIGPFGHLRRGAHLAQGVHLGNFGEVKNSYLGPETKMGHFSYLGDARVGRGVNIGAGTITCNYDGKEKHQTVIGEGAFIGSDTMLVAPVELGKGSRTGAGAVVTKDVSPGGLAVGVPAREIQRDESSSD